MMYALKGKKPSGEWKYANAGSLGPVAVWPTEDEAQRDGEELFPAGTEWNIVQVEPEWNVFRTDGTLFATFYEQQDAFNAMMRLGVVDGESQPRLQMSVPVGGE